MLQPLAYRDVPACKEYEDSGDDERSSHIPRQRGERGEYGGKHEGPGVAAPPVQERLQWHQGEEGEQDEEGFAYEGRSGMSDRDGCHHRHRYAQRDRP